MSALSTVIKKVNQRMNVLFCISEKIIIHGCIIEPQREIAYLRIRATSKESDQPVYSGQSNKNLHLAHFG